MHRTRPTEAALRADPSPPSVLTTDDGSSDTASARHLAMRLAQTLHGERLVVRSSWPNAAPSAPDILREASRRAVDLIVIGARDATGEAALGATTSAVIADAPCPVVAVLTSDTPPDAPNASGMAFEPRLVVVPDDGGSAVADELARRLSVALGVPLRRVPVPSPATPDPVTSPWLLVSGIRRRVAGNPDRRNTPISGPISEAASS